MNYQLIKNEEILNNFIDWLPELKINETYFIGIFARKKYIESETERTIIKRKDSQIKRFISKKEFIFQKIKQMECEIGSYLSDGSIIPQEALAVYISPNPRDLENAAKQSLKKLADLITKPYNGYDPQKIALSEIQSSCTRKIFVDFDFDDIDLEYIKENVYSKINKDCLHILRTKGGFHVLVELQKIEKIYERTWYQSLSNLKVDIRGDNLIPVPGCTQGNFIPYFEKS